MKKDDFLIDRTAPHSFPFVELNHAKIISELQNKKKYPLHDDGRATMLYHVGVAGFFNFDIMAVRKPAGAILIDINPAQSEFWYRILDEIDRSPTRQKFVENCSKWINDIGTPLSRFDGKPMVSDLAVMLHKELSRTDSWLSSDERYQTVREMSLNKDILCETLDLTNKSAVFNFSCLLNILQATIDTLYLSNIAYFLMGDHNYYGDSQDPVKALQLFKGNIVSLTDRNTKIIESSIRKSYAIPNHPSIKTAALPGEDEPRKIGGRKAASVDVADPRKVDFNTRIHIGSARFEAVIDSISNDLQGLNVLHKANIIRAKENFRAQAAEKYPFRYKPELWAAKKDRSERIEMDWIRFRQEALIRTAFNTAFKITPVEDGFQTTDQHISRIGQYYETHGIRGRDTKTQRELTGATLVRTIFNQTVSDAYRTKEYVESRIGGRSN